MADELPQTPDKKDVVIPDGPNPGPAEDKVIDSPAPDPEPAAPPAEAAVVAEKPAKPPRTDRAAQIADKIKRKRAADAAPEFTGDMSDPAQTAGVFGRPAQEEPVAEPAPAPAADPQGDPAEPAPKVRKLKVRHQEIELTEDEFLAAAQKGLAGDSYLEEARRLRDEAAELRRAASAPPPRPHQGDPSAHDDVVDPVPEPTPSDPRQGRKEVFKQLIEDIQFGNDSEAAAERLMTAISETSAGAVSETVLTQRMQADFEDTMSVFRGWKDKDENKAVASDPVAETVMERMLYDGYREDLRAVGIPDDTIPKDPIKLANFHRLNRVQGRKVRSTEALLNASRDKYLAWRNGTPAPTTPTATPHPAPRPTHLRVAIDRNARRESIPTQPARSAAPQQAPLPPTSGNSRKEAIAKARAARGQRVVTA